MMSAKWISVLLFFVFFCCTSSHRSSRSKVSPAFGAPAKFVDFRLPTYLDVGKHFLWRLSEFQNQGLGLVTRRAVAIQVNTLNVWLDVCMKSIVLTSLYKIRIKFLFLKVEKDVRYLWCNQAHLHIISAMSIVMKILRLVENGDRVSKRKVTVGSKISHKRKVHCFCPSFIAWILGYDIVACLKNVKYVANFSMLQKEKKKKENR